MTRSGPSPSLLIRTLLAVWLVMLPWFTVAASQADVGEQAPVAVEMPCHGHMADQAEEPGGVDCPHCAGDTLSLCKCCSFASATAMLNMNVSSHLHSQSCERHALARWDNPPPEPHEPLLRPPIISIH